ILSQVDGPGGVNDYGADLIENDFVDNSEAGAWIQGGGGSGSFDILVDGNLFAGNGGEGLSVVAGFADAGLAVPDPFDHIEIETTENEFIDNGNHGAGIELFADETIRFTSSRDTSESNGFAGVNLLVTSTNRADIVVDIDELSVVDNVDVGLFAMLTGGMTRVDMDRLVAEANGQAGVDLRLISDDSLHVNLMNSDLYDNDGAGLAFRSESFSNTAIHVNNVVAESNRLAGLNFSRVIGSQGLALSLSNVTANHNEQTGLGIIGVSLSSNLTATFSDITTHSNGFSGVDAVFQSLTNILAFPRASDIAHLIDIEIFLDGLEASGNADNGIVISGYGEDRLSLFSTDAGIAAHSNGLSGVDIRLTASGSNGNESIELDLQHVAADGNVVGGVLVDLASIDLLTFDQDIDARLSHISAHDNQNVGIFVRTVAHGEVALSLSNSMAHGNLGPGIDLRASSSQENVDLTLIGVQAHHNEGDGILGLAVARFVDGQDVRLQLHDLDANSNRSANILFDVLANDDIEVTASDITAIGSIESSGIGLFLSTANTGADVETINATFDGIHADDNEFDGITFSALSENDQTVVLTNITASGNGADGVDLVLSNAFEAGSSSDIEVSLYDIDADRNGDPGIATANGIEISAMAGGTSRISGSGLTVESNEADGVMITLNAGADGHVGLTNVTARYNGDEGIEIQGTAEALLTLALEEVETMDNSEHGVDATLESRSDDVTVLLTQIRAEGNGIDSNQVPLGLFSGVNLFLDDGGGAGDSVDVTGRNLALINNADHGVDIG
ncbi:MAG: hypothetical protein AAF492_09575, partial [Verrucomicrobiota bacterium]